MRTQLQDIKAPDAASIADTMFLIADDKPFFRDMAHTALIRGGARNVKHAIDIETSMKVLKRFGQQIGCVICDWDMAPAGGLDLLRMIRSGALPRTTPRTPVVILTARASNTAVKAAMAMDVNGFAVAPLSVEKLVKTVTQAIGRTWTLQSPEHYAAVPTVESSQATPPPAQVAKDKAKRTEDAAEVASKPTAPAKQRPPTLVNVRMRVLSAVKPGDIVARDIKDRDGHLMLSAGTALRASFIERLNDMAAGHGDSFHVWVGDWDTA